MKNKHILNTDLKQHWLVTELKVVGNPIFLLFQTLFYLGYKIKLIYYLGHEDVNLDKRDNVYL